MTDKFLVDTASLNIWTAYMTDRKARSSPSTASKIDKTFRLRKGSGNIMYGLANLRLRPANLMHGQLV